jgi:uroporphyrinogen decarboxylase
MNQNLEIFKKAKLITPIWLMRQAGRYLPEYMKIRKTVENFLGLCYDADKATEVTMQPIRRYNFDAAIVFSDILVLPHALGWSVEFKEEIGPILQKFKSKDDFKFLQNDPNNKLSIVYQIIKNVKNQLSPFTPLIGFAGSPWTVMSYMLEGGAKKDFKISKKFIYEDKNLAKELINFITKQTTVYLVNQAKAGVDILKLFDSWAGVLGAEEYRDFVIEPTRAIISGVKKHFPNIPIIGFPRNSGFLYKQYIEKTGVDIIAVDQNVPLEMMKSWSNEVIVQGNLDPVVLLTNKDIIKDKVHKILSIFDDRKNFIFNLGHGILPETPTENVEFLVN